MKIGFTNKRTFTVTGNKQEHCHYHTFTAASLAVHQSAMEKEVKQKLIRCVSGSRYWAEIKDTSRLLIHRGKMLGEGKPEIFQMDSGEADWGWGGSESSYPLQITHTHLSAPPFPCYPSYWQGEGLAQDHLPLLGLQDKD